MKNLSYSSFLQLVKDHYSYDIEKEDLARNLLEEITDADIHCKFSSTYLSYLWNGDRNVTKEVAGSTEKASNKKKCIAYFRDIISEEISEHLRDDFYDKLKKLIENDPTIQESKRKSLLALCVPEDYGKFLAYVFLYAIKKDNKGYVTTIGPLDVELLSEANQKCMLCNIPLVETKSRNPFFRYSISKIYPDWISPELDAEFTKIHPKPLDFEDKCNLVCLCDRCASEYLFSPTIEDFDKLYRYKDQSKKHNGLRKSADAYRLEEKIVQILGNIKEADFDSDSFSVFRMKPLKVINKIRSENKILIKSINGDNDVYYYFIKDHLASIDDYSRSFKKIALEVQTCFMTLSESTCDQDEIYNALVQWVLDSQNLPESYRAAAHVVISFFVQNCEVFDEISE